MNATDRIFSREFFTRIAPVYAICGLLALPAFGQQPANPGKPESASGKSGGDGKDVKVSDYGTVDISVQDTDLATVLQMLSIEGKKNIITSKGVSATVTANLYDVTFYEALKAILDVNGFTFYEEGNFIYVITKEEAVAMEKARRKTESRIFELEYLSANDANEFILPLLSGDGKASARGEVQPGMKPDVTNNGEDGYAFTPRLVVNDYPENLDAIAGLLTNLDTPPKQVLVEATILQTAVDEADAFGVDFTVLGSINFTDLTNPLAAVNNLLAGSDSKVGFQPPDNNGQAITSSVGGTAGPAGLKVGVVSDDISVFLRVLDEVTDTTVLARPKIMALNRQRAEVLVGARVGYLSTTSTETTTTQSVQFLDTGIQLIFRPFISKDGMIRLELKPSVSEASLRSVTDSNGQVVTIPDELTNQVTTNVRVKDGQTLVLGGLFKESTRVTRRQVPYLGDVPILGSAFKGNEDKVERSEVIFLITPSITHDDALWANGAELMDDVDSLRVGAREGLLPFSQAKVTGNYNLKAMDAFNRGDNDKALHYINNSLHVNENQPEMIRLRDQVSGEKSRIHERSTMERVFHKETQAAQPAHSSATSATDTHADANGTFGGDPSMELTPNMTDATSVEPTPSSNETTWQGASTNSVAAEESNLHLEAFEPQANAGHSSTGLSSQSVPLSPQQRLYYQNFLHDFFATIGMPDIAACYASADGTDLEQWSNPGIGGDSTEVAGVSDAGNDMK